MSSVHQIAFGGRVRYGHNASRGLPDIIDEIGSTRGQVVMVCDPHVRAIGLIDGMVDDLMDAGAAVSVFDDITGDPKSTQVDAAAEMIRSTAAGAVVAVGGGSSMDVGKMSAAIAGVEALAMAFSLGQETLPSGRPTLVCIPTTAGTGAEVTRIAAYSDPAGAKLWASGEALRADVAILDPLLTVGLPPPLTAATGADVLVHAIEACTNREAQPMVDPWALHAIRLVAQQLPQAVARPDDIEARGMMLIAACLAGLSVDACGTGIAHALGHALGAVGQVHHGRAVALSLRVALPANAAAAPARHAEVARAMGHFGEDDDQLASFLASHFDAFLRRIGIEISLAADGMPSDSVDRVFAEAIQPENAPMREANCRDFAPEELRDLVRDLVDAA